jgi:hypothetical protein
MKKKQKDLQKKYGDMIIAAILIKKNVISLKIICI